MQRLFFPIHKHILKYKTPYTSAFSEALISFPKLKAVLLFKIIIFKHYGY